MVSEGAVCKEEAVRSEWYKSLSNYERPSLPKAIGQMADTFVPYVALWIVMAIMLKRGVSYWYVAPLVFPAAGLLMRIFIFFHDCCHGAFFASQKANRALGYISGVLVFTPFDDWRHQHAVHHATTGDLDRRGHGDVWTMTVGEYLAAPWQLKLGYRIYRNPVVLFVLAPPFLFLVSQRFPHKGDGARETKSVNRTNVGILAVLLVAWFTIGLKTYLMIQVPIMSVAAAAGVWLFYVQHQYDEVYWTRKGEWDPMLAALEGSSFYKLPKILQWFSGNIGFHHIHHLRPRIPNYNLERCYKEVEVFQRIEPLTFWKSLRSAFLNLWDEQEQRMIGFRTLARRRRQTQS